MALAQTDLPELKRFTFFVSRRFEEGRERFRLHMGFFGSQAEAEEWLGVVREIYPGAWAGEAPGKKLRARAAEAAAAQARHAAGPQTTAAPAAAPIPTPAATRAAKPQSPQATAPAKIPVLVPTLHPPASPPAAKPVSAGAARSAAVTHPARAVPQATPKRPAAAASAGSAAPGGRGQAPGPDTATRRSVPAPARPQATPNGTAPVKVGARPPIQRGAPQSARAIAATQAPQPRTATAAPTGGQRPAVKPSNRPATQTQVHAHTQGQTQPQAPTAAPAHPRTAPPALTPAAPKAPAQAASRAAPAQVAKKPIFADSNVREVMAALDSPQDGTGETRLMPSPGARADAADESSLTDTQVLRFLEVRREEEGAGMAQPPLQADAAAESGISLLKPDDTGTRRALKVAVSHNDPVSFAVQLQWSVQPVELDKVPPLAIFSAYTLYSVEGSREGRKWYGLRLGFFNDAISAKQVAYYVRSEFNSVAVVPVSPQERDRATDDHQRFAGVSAPRKRRESADNEFKLIDSDEAPRAVPAALTGSMAPAASAAPSAAAAARPASAARAATPAPATAARAARKSGGKVGARERRTPQTLEETLEILGANELAIDNGRGESLNDTGVRHLRVEIQKNTPFSRLLERLSERVRKA